MENFTELPSCDKLLITNQVYLPEFIAPMYASKSFYIQERIFIPINRIPDQIKMLYFVEDKKFYNHFGIDVLAILERIY